MTFAYCQATGEVARLRESFDLPPRPPTEACPPPYCPVVQLTVEKSLFTIRYIGEGFQHIVYPRPRVVNSYDFP